MLNLNAFRLKKLTTYAVRSRGIVDKTKHLPGGSGLPYTCRLTIKINCMSLLVDIQGAREGLESKFHM
jgi:hypothetical protein